MSAVRGLKLHSIIEKLSGQCGNDEESESASPQPTSENVGVKRKKQRKRKEVMKTRKGFHEQSDSDNCLSDGDVGQHASETLTQPLWTPSKKQDSVQGDSHKNHLAWHGSLYIRQTDETRRFVGGQVGEEVVKQKVSVQKRPQISLPRPRKKMVHKTKQSRTSCVVPQLQGSGVLFPGCKPVAGTLEPSAPASKLLDCHICIAKFEDQEELDSHVEEYHPDDDSESPDEMDESSEEEMSEPETEEVSTDDTDPTCEDEGANKAEEPHEAEQDTVNSRRLTRNMRKSLLERNLNNQAPDDDLCIDLESMINMATGLDDIECGEKPVTRPPIERPCGKCNKMLESMKSLKLHREQNPECADHYAADLAKKQLKAKEDLRCQCCGKKFQLKKARENHFERSPACRESLKCPTCGRQSKKFSAHKEHMLTHCEERIHQCDKCEASFTQKSYLTRHQHIHSTVKRYTCVQCNKQFTYKASLQAHQWTHTGKKPFKCDYCDMHFTSSSSVRMHAKKHTGDLPFKCNTCDRGFARSHGLRMHLTSHSDQKPFACEVCGKGFKRKDHLRLHEVIHSEEKPHQCDTCQKTFNQYVCLKRHLPCRELERRRQKRSKSQSGEKGRAGTAATQDSEPSSHEKGPVESETPSATGQDLDARTDHVRTLPKQSDFHSADSAEPHGQNKPSEIPKAHARSLKQAPVTLSIGTPPNEQLTSDGTDPEDMSSPLAHCDTEHPLTENSDTAGLASLEERTHSVDVLDSAGVQLFYPFSTTAGSVAPSLLFPSADVFSSDVSSKETYSEGLAATPHDDVSDVDLGSVLSSMDPDHLTALLDQTASFFAPIQS